MSEIEQAQALAALPLTVLLVFVLLGGAAGWWVYGTIHRAVVAEFKAQIMDLKVEIAALKLKVQEWEQRWLSDRTPR